MKRLLGLLLVLLLAAPALAESPTAQSVVTAAYPDAAILASAQDEDEAFFVLDMGDYKPRRLCGLVLQDGAWTMTIDSETAALPDYYERNGQLFRWPYTLTMTLAEDELSLCYKKQYQTEAFIFRRSGGEWRFARYEVEKYGSLYVIEWDGYSLTEYRIEDEQQTPPCPMPWLAEEVSLAVFNASTFPTSLYDLDDGNLAKVAVQLLPGYTYRIGKFWMDAASFLMTRPDGEVVFCGGVYEDGAWTWTESTPLPENVWCDDYHSTGSSIIIGWDHPDGLITEWDDPVYIEYVIYLQEDGSWKVETISNISEEAFHFVPDGLYVNMTGLVYGESTLERDVTKIDWATFPMCLADVLPTMSRDWGVISEPSLPLYADAEGTLLLVEYLYATPVHILSRVGEMAQVQIADSDVAGYLPVSGLLTGEDQLWETTMEFENDEWSYLTTAEEDAWFVTLAEGANLYAASEGEVIRTGDHNVWLVLMADYGDGWAHVKFPESLESCFVRTQDCLPAE